jgi:hypothetical protein
VHGNALDVSLDVIGKVPVGRRVLIAKVFYIALPAHHNLLVDPACHRPVYAFIVYVYRTAIA